MKNNKILLSVCLASMLTLGTSVAQAVVFDDPTGDDNGPGNYTYPTDSVYKPGSFDLTKLAATKRGDQAEFAVDVNSTLEDPWGMGVGYSVQMIFVFIKNAPGGHTEGLPGLNIQFAPGSEWNKVVILSPQKKARVVGEAQTKAPKLLADIVVPNLTRGTGRTIKGSAPLKDLGGDGNVDAWSYQVVMQSNEGFPQRSPIRRLNEGAIVIASAGIVVAPHRSRFQIRYRECRDRFHSVVVKLTLAVSRAARRAASAALPCSARRHSAARKTSPAG